MPGRGPARPAAVPPLAVRLGLVGLVCLGAASGCSTAPVTPDRVTVGLLVPTTGAFQAVGQEIRDGFQQYLDRNGGTLGGRAVDLVVADEGEGGTTAVTAARKLATRDRVDVVTGIAGGGAAAAAIPVLTRSRIPVVGSGDRPDLSDLSLVWHTSYLAADPGRAIAGRLAGTVPGSVFAIGPDLRSGWDQVSGFAEAFVQSGGHLANPDERPTFTPFPTTDFTPYFTQIKVSGAKAVFCSYSGGPAVDFITQYAQSDIRDIPVYATGFITEGRILTTEADAARGVLSVLNYAPDLDNPENRGFVTTWRTRHRHPPSASAIASFDAASVLDRALANIRGPVSPTAVSAELEQTGRVDSPRGPWRFSTHTHTPIQPWYLRQVGRTGGVLTNTVVETLATLGE